MRPQADLLREPWNALIILDACRADSLARRLPGVETVQSMSWITFGWVRALVRLFGREPLLCISSNPVVERELRSHRHAWQVRSVWADGWGRHGPCAMPGVAPAQTAFALAQHLSVHGQPARLVVHFLQPHVPYIGDPCLPYSGWGGGMRDPLSQAVAEYLSVEDALARGLCTIEEVRAAYEANLDVVLPFALAAARDWLRGTVVISADHGELLALEGEDGRYGHAQRHPRLYEVPWLAFDNGPFEPAALPPLGPPADPTHQKLRALGYE